MRGIGMAPCVAALLTLLSPAQAGEVEIGSIVKRLASDDRRERGRARDEIQRMCWDAGRPGAEEERASICRAIAAGLTPATPKEARAWLLRQLEQVGGEEVVDDLVRLLDDREPIIRERARRALQNNPSPRATGELCRALERAREDQWRAALANSLAYRGDPEAARSLARLARSADDEVRAAAANALARTDGRGAAAVIAQATSRGGERARRGATDAYLLLADRLCEAGDELAARSIYTEFMAEEGHLKCAAIVGLGRAGGPDAFTTILNALEDEDVEIRGAAMIALEMMPTEDLVRAARERMRDATPEFKVGLLQVLARRGDRATAPLFADAASDAAESVRVAALEALGRVGDASVVPLLARRAAEGSREESDVAEQSLALLGGEGVDRAIREACRGADPAKRAMLIRVLARRGAESAADDLLAAARAPEESVRMEALKALAKLAGAESIGQVVGLVASARSEKERAQAEKTLVAVCKSVEDEERRARPVLDALPGAASEVKASLLRVLGRLGGTGALAAVSRAVDEFDQTVKDAAVRSLADWPTPDACEGLLPIVRDAANKVHQVLAFRGYVRLIGLDASAGPDERLRRYEEAMRLAPREEDRKLVLAGLAEVGRLEALRIVERHFDDPALRDEAALAAVRIAQAIAGSDRDAAMEMLEKVQRVTSNKTVHREARSAIEAIERYDDYIVAWKVAGPYTVRGKNGSALFNIELPPEKDAPDVKWRTWTGSGERPWRCDLNRLLGGDNRAAYLRAQVYSPRKQEARLEIGSDDGVKVWLNGKVVHKKNVSRGLREGEDKVKVTLEEGWNPLLLKVTENGGDWAACARVRAVDGSKLEGVRTRVE